MAFFDMGLDALEKYKPEVHEEADFDAFWAATLSQSRQAAGEPRFEEIEHHFRHIKIYDVTFSGFAGQSVKGWFLRPEGEGPFPCLIEFIGYGGGRNLPHEWLTMVSTGMAHFVMDTRGQGSGWSPGDTPDPELSPGNGQFPGFMTKGVLDRDTYYYRRVFTDAVRAYETVAARKDIDSARIAVTGGSQGGGISLAAAGLIEGLDAVLTDVPFLCHFHRAIRITDSYPYKEIGEYLRIHRDQSDRVHKTLSYFDGVNFSRRARCDAFFSTALMDMTCPPSTVYAAFNHYAGRKEIHAWEFNDHEGGGPFQMKKRIDILCDRWGL
ncbi:acetylxylan esterase [Spirochaeta isovalerica]|uniref:Cephalosporin-C deacetylase n=1 Tax=Spirochaeta isovalerica TaxID=150 RepID=A0A841R991_9SPIO|nr:acetylxylan esterase [Spirochaeta isovalerica]MBB6479931.1 cephalosporin-C deacetylase [Spirochaeta isovalerica]